MTITANGLGVDRRGRVRLRCAAAALLHALGWPLRVFRARAVLATLGALDDRELRDIGLARQDLRDALALPAGEDPSVMLRHRAWRHRR